MSIPAWQFEKRPDLQKLVAEIQAELRLRDWQIAVQYVPDLCNANGAPVYGLVDRLVDNKTATILIRDPSTPPPNGAEVKAPLAILIHELTHLHFAPFAENTTESRAAEEQAVWPISDALFRHWGTPAAAMIARAMASASGNRAQMIARAMSARAEAATRGGGMPMDPKEYARALRAALAMADGEDKKKALDALAAKMEGDAPPPPSEKKEPPPPPAARAEEVKKEPPAEARAQVITLGDVDRTARAAAAETLERAQLITDNRARMTDGQAALYARMPLVDVKAQIAALPAAAQRPGTDQRSARIKVAPIGGEHAAGSREASLCEQVDALMGVSATVAPPIVVDQRGMSISHVNGDLTAFLAQQRAQRVEG